MLIISVCIYISKTYTQLNKRVDRNYYYILDTCHVPTNVIPTTYTAILRNALCSDDIIM